jgi:hypothetical protein
MRGNNGLRQMNFLNLSATVCAACGKYTLWFGDELVRPATSEGPEPVASMPDKMKRDFEEARSVLRPSPRASAALLRLCVQDLCIHLGKPGKNLNDDIGALVAEGLPKHLQQSLDAVRVVGNNALHPGEMDVADDRAMALSLLDLVNRLTDALVTGPDAAGKLYARLPAAAKAAIDKRDGRP